jgi:hypothetical protein
MVWSLDAVLAFMEAYGDGCCGGGLSFSAMQRVFLQLFGKYGCIWNKKNLVCASVLVFRKTSAVNTA